MPTPRAEGAETARRALRILEIVTRSPEPLLLEELVRLTELNKSTVYRLARVLQEEGYIAHIDGGGYVGGSRLTSLAAAAIPNFDTYEHYLPTLRLLADEAGETATLHQRSGDHAVLILGAETRAHPLRRVLSAGELTTLTRGSAGMAILSTLSEEYAESLIRVHDPAEAQLLRRHLRRAVRHGYALSFGANHPGMTGIAAPLRDTHMSIALSGPSTRWTESRMIEFAPRLLEAIAALPPRPRS